MIIDKADNLSRYIALDGRFKTAAEKLAELPADIAEGRYPVNDGMYLLIQMPKTAKLSEGSFETHRSYIDIQVILEGEEMMSFADTEALTEYTAYNEEKDIALYKGADYPVKISAGMFYIMYPGEAHKCCCHTTPGLPLKKAVFKIKAQTK